MREREREGRVVGSCVRLCMLRECCIYRECYRRAAAATGRKASAAACCAYLPSGTPAGTEVPLSGHSLRFFATVRTPLLTCNKRKKRNTLDIATNYMYMYVSIGRLFCEISVFSSYVQWEGKVSINQINYSFRVISECANVAICYH